MTVTGSREALKLCPFCGGKAKLHVSRCAEDAEEASVRCESCFASTDHFEDAYAPTADAIDRWNTRAADPAPALTVEEIARIIHGVYGVGLGPYAGAHQDKSIDRAATAILSLLKSRSVQSRTATKQATDATGARRNELGGEG